MKIGREIKIVSGIIFFLVVFYLLNPTHESLLRLLEISGILLVTFLAFFASKNLNPRLRYRVTLLVSLVSAMPCWLCNKGGVLDFYIPPHCSYVNFVDCSFTLFAETRAF